MQEEGHLHHQGPTNPKLLTSDPRLVAAEHLQQDLDCWTLVVLYNHFKNIIRRENVYAYKITKYNNFPIFVLVLILPLINWIRTEVKTKLLTALRFWRHPVVIIETARPE